MKVQGPTYRDHELSSSSYLGKEGGVECKQTTLVNVRHLDTLSSIVVD